MPGDGAVVTIGIRHLMAWLITRTTEDSPNLFWGILFWLAAVIDGCASVASSSDDPFAAPALRGVSGRSLKIPVSKRNKVVRIQAMPGVFRSGRALLQGAKDLGVNIGAGSDKTANKWIQPYMYQYMHRLVTTFLATRLKFPVFSVAWDATRLSKLEIMASALYNHELGLAGWMPPQVCSRFWLDRRS